MQIFSLAKLIGKGWLSSMIRTSLERHLSGLGAAALASDLATAGTALAAKDYPTCADALADVILNIH